MKSAASYLSIIFFLGWTIGMKAQLYEDTRYADDSGLPNRMIRVTMQDSKGFIWVGGNNGLFKYDGQKFHSFYAALKDTIGLHDNKITALTESRDYKIWVGTPKGLHYIEDDQVHYFPLSANINADEEYILSIFVDDFNNIWVGTHAGLFIIEKDGISQEESLHQKSNYVQHISAMAELNFPRAPVWGASKDAQGRIWLATGDGNYLFPNPGNFNFIRLALNFKNEIKNDLFDCFKITAYDENLLLIDSNLGLLKGRLEKDSSLTIGKFINESGEQVAKHFIYYSILDQENNIWTATWKNKFKKYKFHNGKLEEQEVRTKNGLLQLFNHVRHIQEDAQNNIWISNNNGLFKLSKSQDNIFTFPPADTNCFQNDFNVRAIIEDAGNHLWVGAMNGLYRFNKLDLLNSKCPEDYLYFDQKHFQGIKNLFIDSQNRLWVSSENGLTICPLGENFTPREFINFRMDKGLPHNWCFDVFEESKNTFWIGNYLGLLKFHFESEDLQNPTIKTYEAQEERPNGLINSFVLEFDQDQNGTIWIGTFNGVSKLINESAPGTFVNYVNVYGETNQLSNNSIKKIFKDRQNRIWIGTQKGLNLYDADRNNFFQFGIKEGLPSEYILGISEDSHGLLWISTTMGVVKGRYDNQTQSFSDLSYFTIKEGLTDNINNKNALYIDQDNFVFIGNGKGINIIPNIAAQNSSQPFEMGLTAFKTSNKNQQGFYPKSIPSDNDQLNLAHFENSIQLNYAALDFTNVQFNSYRHKLLPINTDWIETKNISELTFYNLPDGDYELLLDGSNHLGNWSDAPIVIHFKINPPFWKSHWALILYGLSFIGFFRLLYLRRVNKKVAELNQKTRLENALIKEREQLRKENSADFHDELGSKVTKISLYLTLAERSLDQEEELKNWFSKIRENVKELSGGFRDLLWVIDPQKDSLSDTFLRLKDFGEDLFKNSSIDFRTIGYNAEDEQRSLDPQAKKQVVLIFKEAMNNCAKYSHAQKASLTIASNLQYSTITLKDDGKGFDVEVKSKGRGLKNMKDRARRIGSELSITSSEKGTSIQLDRIPHMREGTKLEEM